MRKNDNMTKRNAIRLYRIYSGAEGYIIGFIYKKAVYMIKLKEIPPRYIQVWKSSKKNGHKEKIQLVLNNPEKEELIRKGAIQIGGAEMAAKINSMGNGKGVYFESLIATMNGQTFRGKDSVGFWVCGDIELDGTQYQIKFGTSQIVTYSTLRNLQACGKNYKQYSPKMVMKKTEEQRDEILNKIRKGEWVA